ncbi:hypothetical protein BU16DRAFT_527590, partial [Lophium mytilinum]
MPDLFDLPQEIRDDIWFRAIHQPQPACMALNYRRCSRTVFPRAQVPLINVVDCGPLRSTSLNLLLVNRRIHEEVTKSIDFLRRNNRLCYTVSFTYREKCLVLFWANVPALSPQVHILRLELPAPSTDDMTISEICGHVPEALRRISNYGFSASKQMAKLRGLNNPSIQADIVSIKVVLLRACADSIAGCALKDCPSIGSQRQITQHSVTSLFTSHLIEVLEPERHRWPYGLQYNVFLERGNGQGANVQLLPRS